MAAVVAVVAFVVVAHRSVFVVPLFVVVLVVVELLLLVPVGSFPLPLSFWLHPLL